MNQKSGQPQYMGYLMFSAIILVVLGLVMIFLGAVLSGGELSTGGILLIGPIPVIFGGGPLGQVLALLATILAIILLALMLYLSTRKHSDIQSEDIDAQLSISCQRAILGI